jgi:hypothetical protein
MDILIDPYRFAIALPECGEVMAMVKQSQTAGGASIGDGMAQSGPAVSAQAAFLAGLSSYLTADLNHVTASATVEYDINNPLPLWSGFGELRGKGDTTNFDNNMQVVNKTIDTSGRFNTSANASGNWYQSPLGWDITLDSPRTAFGCYYMDCGDVREGEVEFRLYNGASLVKVLAPPVVFADKPRSTEAMWVGYANGNTPFDRIEAVLFQHSVDPDLRDFVGYDDFAVGECVTCVPSSLPVVHYGANTSGDAVKTVTGAALTARNAWLAAVSMSGVCGFEANTVGTAAPGTAIAFTGAMSGITATLTGNQYSSDHATVAASTTDAFADSAGSLRWNTTSGGSKWYEWTDEAVIQLSGPVTAVGFYVTDLGDQNATLRVTLRRTDGTGVSYYLPKAEALPGANSLLRFWGVTDEVQFTQVVLQTVYYTDLTAGVYDNPVFHVKGTPDVVGLDDLMIGD